MAQTSHPLRPRQKLGKYRIVRRIGAGGFSTVYAALDTVENVKVALKVPSAELLDAETMSQLRKETALHASLDHPNILPIKSADEIEGRYVVAYPLGIGSLDDRLARRLSVERFLEFAEQMLDAVAYAHARRIVHCDIKPENFILFPDNRLRLADFGLAKVAVRTLLGSGSGTVGYIAPEQAMGRTSLRSDVFSLGLMFWRMLSKELPTWPFHWPFPGHEIVRAKVPPSFVTFMRRAIAVDATQRFTDARSMRTAFQRIAEELRHAAVRCQECKGALAPFGRYCPHCRARVTRPWRIPGARRRCPNCRWSVRDDWHACAWCGRKLDSRGHPR